MASSAANVRPVVTEEPAPAASVVRMPAPAPATVSVPVSGSALLLIDVINDLAFDGADALVAGAEVMAESLAAFKRRASAAGIPAIYLNGAFGRWTPDFRQTVAHCTARMSPGHLVSSLLRPTSRDYFVPKPKHSGFFETGLEMLLERLRTRRLIITGIAGDVGVLFTANDAYMRDFELVVPEDCTVSATAEDNAHALRQIATVMKGQVAPSADLRFNAGRAADLVRHP